MKTKTLFVAIILSSFCLMSHAQLKVLSNGKVGIGTNTPTYGSLEIGKSGINNGLAIYDSSLKLYSNGNYGYLNFGGVAKQGIIINKGTNIQCYT